MRRDGTRRRRGWVRWVSLPSRRVMASRYTPPFVFETAPSESVKNPTLVFIYSFIKRGGSLICSGEHCDEALGRVVLMVQSLGV